MFSIVYIRTCWIYNLCGFIRIYKNQIIWLRFFRIREKLFCQSGKWLINFLLFQIYQSFSRWTIFLLRRVICIDLYWSELIHIDPQRSYLPKVPHIYKCVWLIWLTYSFFNWLGFTWDASNNYVDWTLGNFSLITEAHLCNLPLDNNYTIPMKNTISKFLQLKLHTFN